MRVASGTLAPVVVVAVDDLVDAVVMFTDEEELGKFLIGVGESVT
jgi:hypothetical protein